MIFCRQFALRNVHIPQAGVMPAWTTLLATSGRSSVLPVLVPNLNTASAGRLSNGVLSVDLDVTTASWSPEATRLTMGDVVAFAERGKRLTKPNTWKDFIACAEYLIAKGYTSPSKLAGEGGSAGGILIGRALEERPDLFAVAIAHVPMADGLRFETTANGVPNIAEFGSTKTEDGFRGLLAMSPYAHVEDGVKYPAVLITTGINDPRVPAWIPAKLAARLQASTTSSKPVLLRVDYDAGHGGIDATIRQGVASFADTFSFALWQSGDPAFQPTH